MCAHRCISMRCGKILEENLSPPQDMTQYSAHTILNIMPENRATAYYGRKKMRDFNAFLVSHIIEDADNFSLFILPPGDNSYAI